MRIYICVSELSAHISSVMKPGDHSPGVDGQRTCKKDYLVRVLDYDASPFKLILSRITPRFFSNA